MIKLESGSYYRNTGVSYWLNGRKLFDTKSPDDLISESPNPNEQPMPTDHHLQRAIDAMGEGLEVYSVKKYADKYWHIINIARYIARHEPEPVVPASPRPRLRIDKYWYTIKKPDPVDPVLLEARRRIEKYYGDPVGSLDSGVADDYAIMKLVIDALRFNIADLDKPNTE